MLPPLPKGRAGGHLERRAEAAALRRRRADRRIAGRHVAAVDGSRAAPCGGSVDGSVG